MSVTFCGQRRTAEVIHRGYPQAAPFHVKHDVAAVLRLWIRRCISQRPPTSFHVKRGRQTFSTGFAHRLWIVAVTHGRFGSSIEWLHVKQSPWPLPVDNSAGVAPLASLNGLPCLLVPERSRMILSSGGGAWWVSMPVRSPQGGRPGRRSGAAG
jgi:hypothetical protein